MNFWKAISEIWNNLHLIDNAVEKGNLILQFMQYLEQSVSYLEKESGWNNLTIWITGIIIALTKTIFTKEVIFYLILIVVLIVLLFLSYKKSQTIKNEDENN